MPAVDVPSSFQLTSRIQRLLDNAIARAKQPPNGCRRAESQIEAFLGRFAGLPLAERQARSLAWALEHEPVHVFPDERVHGIVYGGGDPQLYGDKGPFVAFAAYPNARRREAAENPGIFPFFDPGNSFLISEGAFPGHVAWQYDLVLSLGIEGLIERHRQALQAAADEEAQAYYQGVIICLEGVLAWCRRHVAALRELLKTTTDAGDRARLEESIAILEHVPAKPARTFREAVQSFYFQWLAVMVEVPYGGNSPGRLDTFLWPWLRDEYERGEVSYQEAAELIAELFIKIDERVHNSDGHVNTIVVGGRAPDGSDAVNPLSWIMLDVFEALPITHPAVYTRVSEVNPPAWLTRCSQYLLTSRNRAQILADEAIIAAMTRGGRMTEADAANYMCGGCMELNPHGLNSDLLFSFLYNVPKTLELVLTGGDCLISGSPRLDCSGPLTAFDDFESLYQAVAGEIRRVLHTKFRSLDIYSEEMARWRPAFLQSSMTGDCLERGRSQMDGGARYPDYGGTPIGIQNAADALYAIQRAVFTEPAICSAGELLSALRENFAGRELLRQQLLAIPKFGEGDPAADALMGRLLADVCEAFDSYTNRHGGRVKPIIFTFVWAPMIGANLGASADGRLAGTPIAHGLTPQAIGTRRGLTTAIASSARLPLDQVRGGASTMWDMDDCITPPVMEAIVRAFIQQGGQIFQGNTTSVAELEAAVANPDAFPHLIVRVGGFSARFVSLNADVQQEIIHRHRHQPG